MFLPCRAGFQAQGSQEESWLLGRNLGIVCAGENLAPLGRSTHSRAGQTDLHPCRNVLRPQHRQQPAVEALTSSPLAQSVPIWEARKDVISSLSRAARSVSTSDEGLHMPSFLLASRHLPTHNPYSPGKAFYCILIRTSHLTFLIMQVRYHHKHL